MNTLEYCNNLSTELTGWRTRIDHVAKKLDRTVTGNKEKVVPEVNELHMIMEELDTRIEGLRTACTTSWEIDMREDHEIVWPVKADGATPVSLSDFGG